MNTTSAGGRLRCQEAASRQRRLMADTGSPAKRQQADLGGQGPRDTKVSFLTLAWLSAPGHNRPLVIR